MEGAWKQIQPKDSFIVKIATPLTNVAQQVLNFIYQPIIGVEAYSLFMTLLTELNEFEYEATEQLHADLLNRMNIGIPQLFQARVRLEGIGLLRVYVQETTNNRRFIYELQPPSSPTAIFQDEILSLVLLESVGERRYQQLVERFAIPLTKTEGYHEITKKFLDVFKFQPQQLAAQRDVLSQSMEQFSPTQAVTLKVVDDSFDWNYFMSLLNSLYIQKEQLEVELKETIYTLHHLYGINELEMQGFVEQAVDYLTNQVDGKLLKSSVYEAYHRKQPQKVVVQDQVETTHLTESEKEKYRYNSLKLDGFSDGDISVILSSEKIAPMQFLASIKKQKGGFVANDERWTVENILKQSSLPNAVINVLIHFVLVAQGNATLNQKYANTIANDWAQKKVFSPEQAIKKVKEMQQQQIERAAKPKQTWNNSKGNKQGTTRKESLPEWANQTNVQETPLSKEENDYWETRLKRLNEAGKEGEN